MAQASSWTGHWLVTPTSSNPIIAQHTLQAGQNTGLRFYRLVDVPFPLLGTLAGWRWPVQAPLTLLLGLFANVMVVDFMKFPLH